MGSLRRFSVFFVWFSVILLVLTTSSHAQNNETEFIGDPGKWVSGPFLNYYHRSENPEQIFGNPITVEFTDPITNHRVQYFEKARFEISDDATEEVVSSAPLGELMFEEGLLIDAGIGSDPSVCHTFINGKEVCYAFWDFYQSQNGQLFFGQPLSNTLINEDGFLVQFFEKGLLEWHPEKSSGERVVVANLGSQYFRDFVGDPQYTRIDPQALPTNINRVPKVNVSVSKAIISANSYQRIFVVVYDQYQQPIPGVMVGVNVTLPDGSESFYRLPETNQSGISILDLTVGDLKPRDRVNIEASVSFGNEIKTGAAWFRIWW